MAEELNKETLDLLTPDMEIEYRVSNGFLPYQENISNLPVIGARISMRYPVVGATGHFNVKFDSYNLYVGTSYPLDYILQNQKVIEEFKKAGFSGGIVSTTHGFFPLNSDDVVYDTLEEMVEAIEKINQRFKSVTFVTYNSLDETLKEDGSSRK